MEVGEEKESIPEVVPVAVGSQHAELSDGVGIFSKPRGPWLLEAGLKDMAVP